MRATTLRPRVRAHSSAPNRVRPRMTPCTSLHDSRSAPKASAEIELANAVASTSSRVLSSSQPAVPMALGTNTLILFLTKCAPFAAISTPQGNDPSLGAAVKSADAPLTLQGRISARPLKNARLVRPYGREQGRARVGAPRGW